MATSSPYVLGIAGSPRRDGNTDLLLQQAMRGAAAKGARTKMVTLSALNISPCRHCDQCLKEGKCAIEDDMQWLSVELRKSDVIILACPIFFMGVTAQTKAMIDRCQALWVIKYVLKLPVALNHNGRRKGLFISVGSAISSNLFQPAIATVKSWFATLDVVYAGELLFSGIDKKGDIANHPTGLKEAFLAGQRLVEG
jgi:multimeric flavodoxin WrbA